MAAYHKLDKAFNPIMTYNHFYELINKEQEGCLFIYTLICGKISQRIYWILNSKLANCLAMFFIIGNFSSSSLAIEK